MFRYFLGQKKDGSRGITEVSRSMWKVTKGKKIEVAMKTLKRDCMNQYLKVSRYNCLVTVDRSNKDSG